MKAEERLSATPLSDGSCRFLVWAPLVEAVDVHLLSPEDRTLRLRKDGKGYHRGEVSGVSAGSRYFYRLDNVRELPDPASRYQPDGVHGPSAVIDADFDWKDRGWAGLPLEKYIIYEIHTGTFTPDGTFDAIIPRLEYLKELGVTAVELMPVSQFPGSRNWGYDGVFPYAAQNSYGGPAGLKRLVNACHENGMAVVLDVVYNHLGPEGNYLAEYGPYFTEHYRTPWGAALNFDGPHSDEVRRFFIDNALAWLTEFHVDALRLDALHSIMDNTPYTFIEELTDSFHRQAAALDHQAFLIAESSADDVRLVTSREKGGYGMDAQWNDDFHHALHTLLTGEKTGYYRDYGRFEQLEKAFREGFIYSGEFSEYRQRNHGSSSKDVPAGRFVVFSQNHDQIGNRAGGERLSRLVDFETLKLTAGLVLLSPFVPLLFMGEEYAETAPFNYFVSHSDPALVEAVRKGRVAEFAAFDWQGEAPDPQDETTFAASKLDWQFGEPGNHKNMFEFYRKLIELRKSNTALATPDKNGLAVNGDSENKLLYIGRRADDNEIALVFNLGTESVSGCVPVPPGRWRRGLDSAAGEWLGPGSLYPEETDFKGGVILEMHPRSFTLFTREG